MAPDSLRDLSDDPPDGPKAAGDLAAGARRGAPPGSMSGADDALWVVCLCAAWCRTCDDYAPVFDGVTASLAAEWPALRARRLDIEDEAELLGDCDVETFPTVAVFDSRAVRFFGPLTPQPETLQRLLRSVLGTPHAAAVAPEVEAFAARLRQSG